MEEQFRLLKEAVGKYNEPTMNAIVDLLESYNNGLSAYFKNREISREFLNTFDTTLTLNEIKKKFDVNEKNQVAFSSFIMDLNLMARSTWYFETEDGRILTGEDLYKRRAVYLASYETDKEVFASAEEEEEADEINDYIESVAFWGDESEIPKATHIEKITFDAPGYELPETIQNMVSLIGFYSLTLERFLIK